RRSPARAGAHRRPTFVAAGDDWDRGRRTEYRTVSGASVVELGAMVDAGQIETLVVPAGMDHGTVQAVDDAGNLGRALAFDLVDGTLGGAQLVLGTRLAVADAADPARRRLSWTARDRSLAALTGDNRPTIAGASLLIVNPQTGEAATLAMPAAGWTAIPYGFRYSDRTHARGPVTRALVKFGRIAKVVASGGGIAFTLD